MTTLVLGNGFDLDLGWKTSYKEFFYHQISHYERFNKNKYVVTLVNQFKEVYWYDLERFIRDQICLLKNSVDVDADLEQLIDFLTITKGCLYDYFTIGDGAYYTKDYNRYSFAFHFLTRFTQFSKIYSFNYTNPIKQLLGNNYEILHVHNERKNRFLILGTDVRIFDELSGLDVEKRNQIERVFVKTSQRGYIKTELDSDLSKSETIVFFGHSFGICDSDYFNPFFTQLINNEADCKDLYIITKDEDSLDSIKRNMLLYDIKFENLASSSTNVHIILSYGDWKNNDEYLALDSIIGR